MAWADRLAAARHANTLKLALHLLHQHWKNGGQPVSLSNVSLTSAGISRGQKIREALATPGRPGVRKIAERFGVNPVPIGVL